MTATRSASKGGFKSAIFSFLIFSSLNLDMCYYVASSFSVEDIIQLEHDFVLQWAETESTVNYCVSGFTHPELPVITSQSFGKMKWGLVPSWIKKEEDAMKIRTQTLNAQAEGLASKPSFRQAFRQQQWCIIPVNGFFEWHHHHNGLKYPFFIYPKEGRYFYLAGLYDVWTSAASTLSSFSIITTPANPRMEWIHNSKKRMPAILSPTAARQWLSKDLPSLEKSNLLQPYSEERMLDHSISRLISSRRETMNQKAILEKQAYPELEYENGLDLFSDEIA